MCCRQINKKLFSNSPTINSITSVLIWGLAHSCWTDLTPYFILLIAFWIYCWWIHYSIIHFNFFCSVCGFFDFEQFNTFSFFYINLLHFISNYHQVYCRERWRTRIMRDIKIYSLWHNGVEIVFCVCWGFRIICCMCN